MRPKKNPKFNPKVTIVIPVYNGSNYMREAIDSALTQEYKNIEVLVVNDGSNDNGLTEAIATSYGNLISYYKKENGGVASALNYGIEKMQGDYFSWLSHDDLYTKDKVSKQIECLAGLSDKTEIVNCSYEVVDANGKYMYTDDILKKYTKEQLETPLFALLMGGIHGCSLLIHRSHFERVGVFNVNLPTTQDYDLWFRMMRGQRIHFIEGCYVKSRCHKNQDSKKLIDKHIEECSDLWIKMISQLTSEEMCEMWGNRREFLFRIRNLLKYERSYKRALEYVEVKFLYELKNSVQLKGGIEDLEIVANETSIDMGLLRQLLLDYKKERKRITYILGNAGELGGLNRVVLTMANALSKIYEVFLICNEASDLKKGYEILPEVRVLGVPCKYLNKVTLSKILYFLSTDVYIESYNCNNEFLGLLKETKRLGIKSIAWNHEFYFIPYHDVTLYDCLTKRNELLKEADAVLWLNSFSATVYSYHNDNGMVMPNPLTITQTERVATGKNKNILAMGRLNDPRKGLKELLQIYAKVVIKESEAELYIVGDTNFDLQVPEENITYNELIKKLKLNMENIHCITWTKNVEKYIMNSRVHVMPSVREGFGLVLTECAEYGIPSVVYSGSGLEDIIENGETGFICSQHDVDEMADRIIMLLDEDNCWKKMSLLSKERNKQYYLENIVKRWEELIDSVVSMNEEDLKHLFFTSDKLSLKNKEVFFAECIKEYETSLKTIAENRPITVISPPVNNECYDKYMQLINSRSWRATEPFRKILSFYKLLKINRNKKE